MEFISDAELRPDVPLERAVDILGLEFSMMGASRGIQIEEKPYIARFFGRSRYVRVSVHPDYAPSHVLVPSMNSLGYSIV